MNRLVSRGADMGIFALILLVASVVVFLLATAWIPGPPRPNLIALGLALYTLHVLVQKAM